MMRVRVPTPLTYCSACDARAPLGIFTHRASVCSVESCVAVCAGEAMRDLGSDSIAAQPRVVVVPQSSRRLSAQTLRARKAQHNVAGRCKRAFELFVTLSSLPHVQLPIRDRSQSITYQTV